MKSGLIDTARPGPTFDAESMRAIRDGRKTQTRWLVKGLPPDCTPTVYRDAGGLTIWHDMPQPIPQPYRVGTVYYARESLCCDDLWVSYRGDGTRVLVDHTATGLVRWPWKSRVLAPHRMPRWAARVFIRITDVRVQRLGEISEEDAIAEGCDWDNDFPPVDVFVGRWCCINHGGLHDGAAAWERDRNKWVAAYTFEILKG